eukprot:Ihof_evm4s116 gene=Ihof_evmTU4s116
MRCYNYAGLALSALGFVQGASNKLSILHAPSEMSFTSTSLCTLPQIADIFAHSLGLTSYRSAPTRLIALNSLDLPKALVLFVVEGESTDYSNAQHVQDIDSTGNDDLSSLVSMLTGSDDSENGILGRVWLDDKGEDVTAYSSADSQPLKGNLADYIRQLPSHSLTLCMSVDSLLARALAPQETKDAVVYSWDNQTQSLVSLGGRTSDRLALTGDAIMKAIPQLVENYVQGAVFNPISNNLTYNNVIFNMNKEADFLLLVELVATMRSLEVAAELTETATAGKPDFLAFSLIGCKGIISNYGSKSVEAQACKKMTTAFIEKASLQANQIYTDAAVVMVVELNVNNDTNASIRRQRA